MEKEDEHEEENEHVAPSRRFVEDNEVEDEDEELRTILSIKEQIEDPHQVVLLVICCLCYHFLLD